MKLIIDRELDNTIYRFDNVDSFRVVSRLLHNPDKEEIIVSFLNHNKVWAIVWDVYFKKESGLDPKSFIIRTFPPTEDGSSKNTHYMKHLRNSGLLNHPEVVNAIAIDWKLMGLINKE